MLHQFPLNDPETKALIKGAMNEKRLIEAGKMKLEEASFLPQGTTVENGKVTLPASVGLPVLFVLGAIVAAFVVAAVLFYLIDAVITGVTSGYLAPTTGTYFLVAMVVMPIGLLLFWLREFVRHELYGILEVAFGIATALQVLRPEAAGLVRIVALIAGTRIIVDGIYRYWQFSKERRLAGSLKHRP